MIYNKNELNIMHTPHESGITNANGNMYPIETAGDIELSDQLCLRNTLVVSSQTTNLIFVSQLTNDHNCVVFMFPDYCVFQDILMKKDN
jgi:hypothetical protein